METFQLPASAKEILESTRGDTLEQKVFNLLVGDIERRLHLCSERVLEFEKKYGMSFGEFEQAWQAGEISDKHSHEVERDYMEWESLDDEHRLLLSQLRKIKEEIRN
jgi:hypothetical protein